MPGRLRGGGPADRKSDGAPLIHSDAPLVFAALCVFAVLSAIVWFLRNISGGDR